MTTKSTMKNMIDVAMVGLECRGGGVGIALIFV